MFGVILNLQPFDLELVGEKISGGDLRHRRQEGAGSDGSGRAFVLETPADVDSKTILENVGLAGDFDLIGEAQIDIGEDP